MNLKKLFGLSKKSSEDEESVAIEASVKLKELSRITLAERNLEWDKSFMKYAGKAKLASKIPQIAHGKDGFPYFQMEIPDVGAPFESYTIENMIEEKFLKDGYGVSISSYDEAPDMTLSYGELLNYHYRKTFRSNMKNWIKPTPDQFAGKTEILGGNPSEQVLQPYTRKVILAYMVKNNFHFPKVSLLNIMSDHGIMNQLVFNLVPSYFRNENHFQAVLSSMAWFLPVHYTYTAIPEHYLEDLFFDL